jgi:excisionase family DNA binding protein
MTVRYKPSSTNRQTITVDELAELLAVDRNLVYRGLRSGEIPSVRVGRKFIIYRPAIEAWLMKHKEGAA